MRNIIIWTIVILVLMGAMVATLYYNKQTTSLFF